MHKLIVVMAFVVLLSSAFLIIGEDSIGADDPIIFYSKPTNFNDVYYYEDCYPDNGYFEIEDDWFGANSSWVVFNTTGKYLYYDNLTDPMDLRINITNPGGNVHVNRVWFKASIVGNVSAATPIYVEWRNGTAVSDRQVSLSIEDHNDTHAVSKVQHALASTGMADSYVDKENYNDTLFYYDVVEESPDGCRYTITGFADATPFSVVDGNYHEDDDVNCTNTTFIRIWSPNVVVMKIYAIKIWFGNDYYIDCIELPSGEPRPPSPLDIDWESPTTAGYPFFDWSGVISKTFYSTIENKNSFRMPIDLDSFSSVANDFKIEYFDAQIRIDAAGGSCTALIPTIEFAWEGFEHAESDYVGASDNYMETYSWASDDKIFSIIWNTGLDVTTTAANSGTADIFAYVCNDMTATPPVMSIPSHLATADYNEDGIQSTGTGMITWPIYATFSQQGSSFLHDARHWIRGSFPSQQGDNSYLIHTMAPPHYVGETENVGFESEVGNTGEGLAQIYDPDGVKVYQVVLDPGDFINYGLYYDMPGDWDLYLYDNGGSPSGPEAIHVILNVLEQPDGDNLYELDIVPDPPSYYGDDVAFSAEMTYQWNAGIYGNMQILRPDATVEYSANIPSTGSVYPYILVSGDPDYVDGVWTIRVKDSDDTWTGSSVVSDTVTIPADNPAVSGEYTITFPEGNETQWLSNFRIDICSENNSATTQGYWEIRSVATNSYKTSGDVNIGDCRNFNGIISTAYAEGYYYIRVRDQGGTWADPNVENETFYVYATPVNEEWYIQADKQVYLPYEELNFVCKIPVGSQGMVMMVLPSGETVPVSIRIDGSANPINKTAMWVLAKEGKYHLKLMSFNESFPGMVAGDTFIVSVGGSYLRTNKFDGNYLYSEEINFVGYHDNVDAVTELVIFINGAEKWRYDVSNEPTFSRWIKTRLHGDGSAWLEKDDVMISGTYVTFTIDEPSTEISGEYLGVSVAVWFIIIGGCVVGALILIPYKVVGEFNPTISGIFATIGLGINVYLNLWPLWVPFLVALLIVVYFVYKMQRS